eukprot:gene5242-3755_t
MKLFFWATKVSFGHNSKISNTTEESERVELIIK